MRSAALHGWLALLAVAAVPGWLALLAVAAVPGDAVAAATAPASSGLAFTSYRAGAAHVYAVNADGSGLRRLTRTPKVAYEGSPAYSPDGARIAYVCGNFELCVMNADGSAQGRLTKSDWPREFRYDRSPAWSPDGTQIAFVRTLRGRDAIWIVGADGSGARQLPVPSGFNGNPAFSPDATTIAFDHAQAAPDGTVVSESAIHAIGVDGSAPRRLTGPGADATDPAWSPDGSTIAFTDASKDFADVVVMNADGTRPRRVTPAATDESHPAWSPDASALAFAGTRARTRLLFVVAPTGGPESPLTGGRGPDLHPAWRPLGPPSAVAAYPLPALAAAPSTATADARAVARLAQAGIELTTTGNPARGTGAQLTATAMRLEGLATRLLGVAKALRPSSRRGKRVQRLVLTSMRGARGVAAELRAAVRSQRRGRLRDAQAHRTAAFNDFFGISFALADGGALAGTPRGVL